MKLIKKTLEKQKNLNDLLNADLTGCTVQLYQGYFKKGSGLKAENNLFLCQGGFGCRPGSIGSKVFGKFSDGEECMVRRSDIEKIIKGNNDDKS